jgi:hypothetical protein
VGAVERGIGRRLAIGADVARRLAIDPRAFTGWGSGRRRVEAITNLSDVERQQLLSHLAGRLDEIVRRDGRPAALGANGGP